MATATRNPWLTAGLALAAALALSSCGLVLAFRPRTEPNRQETAHERTSGEDALETTRETLARTNDVGTCRSALEELNLYLARNPAQAPPPLTDEQRQVLSGREGFGLRPEEVAEVESGRFTRLDAHYVALCFLLADAARSLELEGLSQPEQAAAAFAWVVRQVRLVERNEGLLPPQFVLLRGWGTAEERALIFVELLQQLGIPGCVLATPGDKPEEVHPLACGALVALPGEKKAIVLFDPRLGLPLPGAQAESADSEMARAWQAALPLPLPHPQELATLAALRARPALLDPLKVDDKHGYDVTPARLQQSRLYAATMLTALAPRMRSLEEDLVGPGENTERVRLALDPVQTLAAWRDAAAEQGAPALTVAVWPAALGAQRQFWPPEEGGSDQQHRYNERVRELVPVQILPAEFRSGEQGVLGTVNEQRLQSVFGRPFVDHLLLDPRLPPEQRLPRDQELRGRFEEAVPTLVKLRDQLREQKDRRQTAPELRTQLRKFVEDMLNAQAEASRAESELQRSGGKDPNLRERVEAARERVQEVWRQYQEPLSIELAGLGATVREGEVAYLLALCKQEQAERLTARWRRSPQGEADSAHQEAQSAWKDAVAGWETEASAPPAPVYGLEGRAAGRLLEASAREALGEHDRARQLLEDLANLTALEQTARLYLVAQLKK